MPGTNLTREEARERASVVSDAAYDIALDLTLEGERFGSVTTLRFAAQPGSSTFVDIVDAELASVTLNGRELAVAAYEVIRDHGVDALSADAVAQRAGVSRRTFFNYFATVEASVAPIVRDAAGCASRER